MRLVNFDKNEVSYNSGDRAVGTVMRSLGYGLDVVRIPVGARDFSLLQIVHDGSGIHPASYSMGISGTSLVNKETAA
jgi:hypothetical protein